VPFLFSEELSLLVLALRIAYLAPSVCQLIVALAEFVLILGAAGRVVVYVLNYARGISVFGAVKSYEDTAMNKHLIFL